MATGIKKKKKKSGNSVAEKNVEQNCRWLFMEWRKKKKRGVYRVNPGVFCNPSRRTKRGASMYVCSSHVARLRINRVIRLPVLLVVNWTGKLNISLSSLRLTIRSRETGSCEVHDITRGTSIVYHTTVCNNNNNNNNISYDMRDIVLLYRETTGGSLGYYS